MKVRITGGEKNLRIDIPDWLLFGRLTLWLAARVGGKYAPEGISPEQMKILLEELRKVKKKHGSWVLVEVNSADGEQVKVEL